METLDIISQISTSEQWEKLLKGPLERAAGQGNRGLAQKLVKAGALIGDALHEAVRGSHAEIMNDLLDNGASINAKNTEGGRTPLHVAAEEGKPEMVHLLLLRGADKDAFDTRKDTPLYAATLHGHVTAALALLAGGAGVSTACGGGGRSVLHMAAKEGHVDILRAAIEHGADVDAADREECTALHIAAHHNRAKAIDVLVQAGADIQVRDSNGSTPLLCAARSVSLEALTALLKHDKCVNKTDRDFRTPLHFATRPRSTGTRAVAVVDLLLRSGADETLADREGNTAEDIISSCGYNPKCSQMNIHLEYIRLLLKSAPADRAWRRRGYLALCRAYPDRVRQVQKSSRSCTSMMQETCSFAGTDINSCNDAVGDITADKRVDGGWVSVMARVLGLHEEDIFRAIVGYL